MNKLRSFGYDITSLWLVSLRRNNPCGLLSVEANAAWPRYAVTKTTFKQFN
jgi:hypothetical protein